MKAVIFDLNGVFIKSEKLSDRFSARFGVARETFLGALTEIMAKVRLPDAVTAWSLWMPYLNAWGIGIKEEELWDFWFSGEKEVPAMVELAKKLKAAGISVFILSNNFKERTEYYDKTFPFLREIVDRVYYSWQTGFVKPDVRAFELVVGDNQLSSSDTVYFDDSEANVKVANSLGLNAYLFVGPQETASILGIE